MVIKFSLKSLFIVLLLWGCAAQSPVSETSEATTADREVAAEVEHPTANKLATVRAVEVSGEPGAYTFAVTIESPDAGCNEYANWWEVVTEDGTLLYRRILAHSHVDEQPFTRSGGPVAVDADQPVIVRLSAGEATPSHMRPKGYSARAMQGTASAGWTPITLPTDFFPELAVTEPLPSDCVF